MGKRSEKDTAHIYNVKHNQWHRIIHIRHDLFSSPVTYEVFNDRIEFNLATIDSLGKTYSFSYTSCGWWCCSFRADDCPIGHFLIDEEDSTEDKVIIYFEDKI